MVQTGARVPDPNRRDQDGTEEKETDTLLAPVYAYGHLFYLQSPKGPDHCICEH